MRVGILGGTFNPPHLGHLICAQEAYVHLQLDRLMLVPTHVPPHKTLTADPGAEERLELCRLAVAGDERLEVSDLEVRRAAPSYTVDTLEELTALDPDSHLFLILGADIAAGLPDWREPERVLSLATLAVAERPGTSREEVQEAVRRLDGGSNPRFFPMPAIAISSTEVRDRVRAGQPIRYLVPDAVADRIRARGLYAGGGQ